MSPWQQPPSSPVLVLELQQGNLSVQSACELHPCGTPWGLDNAIKGIY